MNTFIEAGSPKDIALGHTLISAGKVGCIVLAGGDGSRLGWNGPKGTFPLSLVKRKTLFQMLEEKVNAASEFYQRTLPLAIMTSPTNHETTKKAFQNTTSFFLQNTLPLLDLNKNPLKEERPNGNGEVLKCFYNAGLYHQWKNQGVEMIQVILIDNPLAEPFDPNQIAIHFKKSAELTLKTIRKIHQNENVGVIGFKEGKPHVVEYNENPPKDWNLANTSLFSFSMDFVEKVYQKPLPIHIIKKFFNGKPFLKQECFLFDLIPFAEKMEIILYPREETFAPLKTCEDLEAVQKALLTRDQKTFSRITGIPISEKIFELHPSFHYPTDALKKKWRGKSLPDSSYIEP